ncbi:MAG TPA: site-2 protease family protein [Candidatus Saccharimonadales bacterium]|nr:site-2 protease family protein [Candidatus Saccharimonadales bacterium]
MNIDVVYILIVIVVILISMTLHEAMHAFTSYWLGDDTAKAQGRLTLNPIKHIDPFLTIILPIGLALVGAPIFGGAKPVPFNPQNVRFGEWGAALVAVAGPLTNLFLAFIIFGISVIIGMPAVTSASVGTVGQILTTGVLVNLGFFIFNIIPIPPLDGSRVLYALAPEFVRRGMEAMERFGIVFIFLIILVAGSSLSLFMIGAMTFFLDVFSHLFNV